MKYGIEFEYFVSKDGNIIPAYKATKNLDGNPFIGELRTDVFDSIVDCVFDLEKKIFLEKSRLSSNGFLMRTISIASFPLKDIVDFRKDKEALNKKELDVLDEFSIYPNGKTGKILKTGLCKASLQVNLSQNKTLVCDEYKRISVDEHYKYERVPSSKIYSSVFNYVDIIKALDNAFKHDITETGRVKGVYAIKAGSFGERIEYRSLPNTIDLRKLVGVLQ